MSHDGDDCGDVSSGDDDQLNWARLMDAYRTVSSVSIETISTQKTLRGIQMISESGEYRWISEFLDL